MAVRILFILTVALSLKNPAFAQSMDVDVTAVTELVKKWNGAHSIDKVNGLSSFYLDTVDYYGSRITLRECISKKRMMLERKRDFQQTIKKDLLLSAYRNGIIRCDVVTTVMQGTSAVDNDTYLLVKMVDGEYLIVGESDLLTDRKIANQPYFGPKVTIKDVPHLNKRKASQSWSFILDLTLLAASLALGILALMFAFRKWSELQGARRSQALVQHRSAAISSRRTKWSETYHGKLGSDIDRGIDLQRKGYAFEKYVVKQFDRRVFTLLDWRSDKFHDGIYAKSTRDPDLVYEFRFRDAVRKFSVECKYRSKAYNDSVRLMDEKKFSVYEAYQTNIAPVYIALGLGGTPENPQKLYLIPLANAKPEMHLLDMARYRKHKRNFYYDLEKDRLT